MTMGSRTISKVVHWLLLVLTVLLVLTGLGITEYQVITAISFGLLGKAASFKLHLWLWIPFVVVLIAHVLLTTRLFRRRRTEKSDSGGV